MSNLLPDDELAAMEQRASDTARLAAEVRRLRARLRDAERRARERIISHDGSVCEFSHGTQPFAADQWRAVVWDGCYEGQLVAARVARGMAERLAGSHGVGVRQALGHLLSRVNGCEWCQGPEYHLAVWSLGYLGACDACLPRARKEWPDEKVEEEPDAALLRELEALERKYPAPEEEEDARG